MNDPLLEVRPSEINALGVFARRPIASGTRIIEYTGEVISPAEADRRYDDGAMKRHHTFLFALADGRCIDGAAGGNDARLINHSCDPNCEATEVHGRIWIDAIRPIATGEELTYDYAYEWEDGDEAVVSFYACRCGAPACRHTILARPGESPQGAQTP